jgi:hypothetical protein
MQRRERGRFVAMRAIRIAAGVALAAGAVLALTSCVPTGPTVATFEVAGGPQTYKIELDTPELIQHVKDLMAGSSAGRIPNGKVDRSGGGVNAPWSWHIDPSTLEFADNTIEVCGGLPEYVADHTITSDYYCPWSAKAIKLEGPGAN